MRLAALLALAVSAVSGCDSHPATQVIVYFHASAGLRESATGIHVEVTGPEGQSAYDDTNPPSPGPGALARVPLVPRDGDASRIFRVEGTLLDAGGAELARVEAVAGYVADELREIHLWFDDDCRGVVSCGEGRTCDRGVCVGSCVEPSAPGETDRSAASCSECEACMGGACVPVVDGTGCGCPETDACAAGQCVTSKPVAEVYGGHLHTCAGLRSGGVYCWGSDRVGQLGIESGAATTPQAVVFSSPSTGVAATDHTCWLTHGGARSCWGWNGHGQLGLGTIESMAYQTPTPAPDGDPPWSALDSGWYFTCGLTQDGQIGCWGSNDRGQSGIDPAEGGSIAVPTMIDEATDWENVTAGGFHACGLKRDRTLWCWGLNDSGELGVGDNANRHQPVQTGCPEGTCLEDWIAVAAGDFHTCAIRGGGELWCWGGGLNGQLGVGPVMDRDSSRPLRVLEGEWRVVSAGQSHTCGIRDDGSLWCWGRNDFGQVGDGGFARRDEPSRVRAPGGDEWIRIGTGRDHTCAIRSDESLWCWGWNDDGQLGLGFAEENVAVPRRVCFPP